jgi:hypothetical protein
MTSSGNERQSVGQLVSSFAVFFVTAAAVTSILMIAWRDWTVLAGVWVAMYFMGGVRWFPWGTPIRKAFSIGIFFGTLLPTLAWIYKLNH